MHVRDVSGLNWQNIGAYFLEMALNTVKRRYRSLEGRTSHLAIVSHLSRGNSHRGPLATALTRLYVAIGSSSTTRKTDL